MEKNKIEINTEERSIMYEGKSLQRVTYIGFEWEADERFPNITIKQDASVSLKGTLITSEIKPLRCECGYYVGEFIGLCADVTCPSCGKLIHG